MKKFSFWMFLLALSTTLHASGDFQEEASNDFENTLFDQPEDEPLNEDEKNAEVPVQEAVDLHQADSEPNEESEVETVGIKINPKLNANPDPILPENKVDAESKLTNFKDVQSRYNLFTERKENPQERTDIQNVIRDARIRSEQKYADDQKFPIELRKKQQNEEQQVIETLLKNNKKARLFFIWSSGFFGGFRQAFIGGSPEEQKKFFDKIVALLATAYTEKQASQSFVIDLILDESTLKNALPTIDEISKAFPGSIRVEVIEKLRRRIEEAYNKGDRALNYSGTPINALFLDQVPLYKRFDFSFLRTFDKNLNPDVEGTLKTPSEKLNTFLKDVFANALNGNPALSSDILRVVLLNDQDFDWNIYLDIDTFNADRFQNLASFLRAFIRENPMLQNGVFFPGSEGIAGNNIILGYGLSDQPETFKNTCTEFLTDVFTTNHATYDIFKVYRDQMKQIKYHYPEQTTQEIHMVKDIPVIKENLSVQDTVERYVTQLEEYGEKLSKNTDGGQNLAEAIIGITGPGRMLALRGSNLAVGIASSGSPVSSQSWIEGKMTRLAGAPTYQIMSLESEVQQAEGFAFLLLLDDLPLLEKTKDFKFINALIQHIKTRWAEIIPVILKKFQSMRSYKRLIISFLKYYAPGNLQKNWDAFFQRFASSGQTLETLKKDFPEYIAWIQEIFTSSYPDAIIAGIKNVLQQAAPEELRTELKNMN